MPSRVSDCECHTDCMMFMLFIMTVTANIFSILCYGLIVVHEILMCRLHGSCNHIAGLLFRVEYAVRTGLVDVSCTSQACVWNLPSAKGSLTQPHVAAKLEWKRAHYAKQSK